MSGSRTITPHRIERSRAGPIVGEAAQRICRQSGIHAAIADKRLITLDQLRWALGIALREAEAAERNESFWPRALVAVGFAQTLCNVVLDVLADEIPRPSSYRAISRSFGSVRAIVDADVFRLARAAANDAGGTASDPARNRAEIVKEALDGGLETRRSLRYIVDTHLDMAEKGLKGIGDDRLGRIVHEAREMHGRTRAACGVVQDHIGREAGTPADGLAARGLVIRLRALDAGVKHLQDLAMASGTPRLRLMLA